VPASVIPQLVLPKCAMPKVEAGKLALLVGAALHHCGTLSQFGEGPLSVSPEGYLEISRSDAARMKIVDDDEVAVSTASGTVRLKARVSPRMSEGVVFSPYHFAGNPINQIWSGAAVTSVTISK